MVDQARLTEFPSFDDFARVVDPALYAPVPDDWVVGLTDVVDSTAAIAKGRYKAINVAGSSAISALMNRFATRHFPFAFGGDGCVFALPEADAPRARETLAQTAAWVRDDLDLALRAAIIPVETLRAGGADVRVALYKPTPHVAYAMFDGGGIALAERLLKAGEALIPPAPPGARPDLTGLSCRWQPIRPRHGTMLSAIVVPGPAGEAAFRRAVADVLALLADEEHVRPVAPDTLRPALVSEGLRLEALARRGRRAPLLELAKVAAHNVMGWTLLRTGRALGPFDPSAYRDIATANADCRKFGDALQFTADCDAALESALLARLDRAETGGELRYGIHRQDAALMTCIVPSYEDDGHFHFIDGAGGGYTAAATDLRRKHSEASAAA